MLDSHIINPGQSKAHQSLCYICCFDMLTLDKTDFYLRSKYMLRFEIVLTRCSSRVNMQYLKGGYGV